MKVNMAQGNMPSRRSVLKKTAGISAVGVLSAGTASAIGSSEESDGKVVYEGHKAKVVQYNEYSYSVQGNVSPERHRELVRNVVWSDSSKVGE
jgi:outer membrane biogenesis lipoprotein LolB